MDGGAGGNPGSFIFVLSLNGPSGPKESSTACSCVGCAPTFREDRAFFPGADLFVDEVDEELILDATDLEFVPESAIAQSRRRSNDSVKGRTIVFKLCNLREVDVRSRT